jgi:short-subunit dehydrogenase
MRTLSGKLVLVTGAAAGIGRALAIELARKRANLLLVDIDGIGLAETAMAARSLGVRADVCVADLSRPEEVSRVGMLVRERFDTLDVLVNNAGVAYYGTTHEMTHEQWRKVLAVNLHAPIQLTKELLHLLFERPEAHIVNMCSIAGLVGMSRLAAYNTSKFALVGFSESLRVEYGPRGIGVTAVCPGLVRTGIFENAMTNGSKAPPQFPNWLMASPERVARAAVKGICKNQGLVLVTGQARAAAWIKRFMPRLLERIQQFRRVRHEGTVDPSFARVAISDDETHRRSDDDRHRRAA